MLKYVTRVDSPFVSEGKDLLVSEFGKDYATYFSILQLIAELKPKESNPLQRHHRIDTIPMK
jgi:AAA+ ATPase superfamily predicted ATPase